MNPRFTYRPTYLPSYFKRVFNVSYSVNGPDNWYLDNATWVAATSLKGHSHCAPYGAAQRGIKKKIETGAIRAAKSAPYGAVQRRTARCCSHYARLTAYQPIMIQRRAAPRAEQCGAVRRRWSADRRCFAAPYGAQRECHFTDVFRATIIAKLTYCSSAWSGLTSAHDRALGLMPFWDAANAADTVLIAFPQSLTFSLKLTNLCSDEYSTMNPTSFTSSYLRKLTVPITCAHVNIIDS